MLLAVPGELNQVFWSTMGADSRHGGGGKTDVIYAGYVRFTCRNLLKIKILRPIRRDSDTIGLQMVVQENLLLKAAPFA